MAKYINSPWGEIHGKLGEVIGATFRGTKVVRAYNKPDLHPASLKAMRLAKKGKAKCSIKGINEHFIFTMLLNIASTNKYNLILPVWKTKERMTHHNYFVKTNLASLYYSIPNKKKFIEINNAPDLKILKVAQGIREPTSWMHPKLLQNNEIEIYWDPIPYSTGEPDDPAYLVIIFWKPISLQRWSKENKIWKKIWTQGNAIHPIAKRKDGKVNIKLDLHLSALEMQKYLYFYLFFSNNLPIKHRQYSDSIGAQIGKTASLLPTILDPFTLL